MGHSEAYLDNELLRVLRPLDLDLLRPALAIWHGRLGQVLYEPGDSVDFAYFPCGSSLVSYLVVLENERAIETVLIGREGVTGGIVSDGQPSAFFRAKVQVPGQFMRIELHKLEEAKSKSPWLRHLFGRYSEFLLAHVFQSMACNAAHSIQQRTAKWVIAAMERVGDPRIPLTQGQLSAMMGVGRSYISSVIQSLKSGSLLHTGRGHLVVDDLAGLKRVACRCNVTIRDHYAHLLGNLYEGGFDVEGSGAMSNSAFSGKIDAVAPKIIEV